jgi:hypothetical protein
MTPDQMYQQTSGGFPNSQPSPEYDQQRQQQQYQQQQQQQQYQQQYQQQQYQQGPVQAPQPANPSPFSLGWQDLKNTPNAVSNIALKGLINCVPILNWCVSGTVGRWGHDLVDGKQEPLPRQTVNKDSFINGFFYVLLAAIVGIILSILNVIPVIGQFATIIAGLVTPTIVIMMYYRYLSYGSFQDAFGFSDLWDKAKRNLSSLWCASFLPTLICNAIAVVAMLIVLGITAAISGVSLYGYSSYSSYSTAYLLTIIGSLGIGFLIAIILYMFISVVGTIWAMRATGYWVAQYAPEWESNFCHGERQRMNAEKAQQQADAQARYQAQAQQQQQWQQQNGQQYQQPQYQQQAQQQTYQQPQYQQQPQQGQAQGQAQQVQNPYGGQQQ